MGIVSDGPAQPDINNTMVVDPDAEFPTVWHREAFIAALEREVEGARVRGDKEQEANAARALARLTGGKQTSAEKRPRGKQQPVEER